ncbi:MAG: hypothetical protein AAGD11_13775 [Planctomycetota bacterium]
MNILFWNLTVVEMGDYHRHQAIGALMLAESDDLQWPERGEN